jgi:hypothetical protein
VSFDLLLFLLSRSDLHLSLISRRYHTASDVIIGALNTADGFNGVGLPPFCITGTSLTVFPFFQSAAAPSPKSGLINGYATYNCDYSAADEPCIQHTKLRELVFPPDAKIRLRFVNAGGHREPLVLSRFLSISVY